MLSIVDVIKASAGYTKPMRSGEELLRSGMVISVGKKEKSNNIIHIQALVLRTSGLNSKHPAIIKLWIDVSQEYGNRLIGDNEQEVTKVCDCPAGASEKCKHILAVMLYLSRIEEADLEDLSCTDIEKQWGTLKTTALKEYEAKSLSEMCHVKGQRDIYVKTMPEVTEEMKHRWRMKLIESTPDSEYSIFTSFLRRGDGLVDHDERVISRSVDKTKFPKKLLTFKSWGVMNVLRRLTEKKLNTCKVNEIEFYKRQVVVSLDQGTEIINYEQGTLYWHKARQVRLTACSYAYKKQQVHLVPEFKNRSTST
ncbi:unnamed protein product [Euphydryas editha]|uniref:SWIM-type domain-containing protein n=1 Tax=Euphydryas editha TaxID=104508 RepID=A0AAU9TNM9_EUPED|nr:unnamed protein product [Euphydryas editha]